MNQLLALILPILLANGLTFDTKEDDLKFLLSPWISEIKNNLDIDFGELTRRDVSDPLIPVVIVPGLIGSRLEAKLDHSTPPFPWCVKNSDWFRIWYSDDAMYSGCFLERMSIFMDDSMQYSVPAGVTIRPMGYGSVAHSCAYMGGNDTQFPQFELIASILKNNFSYVDGVNLRAAPYDWRFGPDMWSDNFLMLRQLIEETYTMNHNQPVSILSMSMGGPYVALFLNQLEQSWKDQYIHSWTSFSGPFGGSTWALVPLVAPSSFGSQESEIAAYALTNLLRGYGSFSWMFPFQSVYGDRVIFSTPSRNYTSSPEDILALLQDSSEISFTSPTNISAEIFQKVLPYRKLSAPGVRMNCIYGTGTPTMAMGYLESDNWLQSANWTLANGDYTVLEESLSVCQEWIDLQNQTVTPFVFTGMKHGDPLSDPRAIKVFLEGIGLINK